MQHPDPIELELIRCLLESITEEMGAAPERSAFSPNIKERRDDSCAIFDHEGQMVAMGEDLPVHLGAMGASVQAFIEQRPLGPGDVGILNDPFSGGSHLPDVTMVQGVYEQDRLLFYVANRAHHSDIGGSSPGSMSPSEEI
jgi:N-methylhydantoinase B